MSNTYYENTRFLIIAPIRSGGTMLCHALDSHPEIFCYRSEPVHKNDPIRKIASTPFGAIDCCLKTPGYEAAGCKLTYEQVSSIGLETINALKPDRIIHLWRENALKQIVSNAVREIDKANGLRTHTRTKRPLQTIILDPKQTVNEIKAYRKSYWRMKTNIKLACGDGSHAESFELTYESICTYSDMIERDLGFRLQKFLGVSHWQLLTHNLVKRNPYPLRDIIENYVEVYDYVRVNAPKYLEYFEE